MGEFRVHQSAGICAEPSIDYTRQSDKGPVVVNFKTKDVPTFSKESNQALLTLLDATPRLAEPSPHAYKAAQKNSGWQLLPNVATSLLEYGITYYGFHFVTHAVSNIAGIVLQTVGDDPAEERGYSIGFREAMIPAVAALTLVNSIKTRSEADSSLKSLKIELKKQSGFLRDNGLIFLQRIDAILEAANTALEKIGSDKKSDQTREELDKEKRQYQTLKNELLAAINFHNKLRKNPVVDLGQYQDPSRAEDGVAEDRELQEIDWGSLDGSGDEDEQVGSASGDEADQVGSASGDEGDQVGSASGDEGGQVNADNEEDGEGSASGQEASGSGKASPTKFVDLDAVEEEGEPEEEASSAANPLLAGGDQPRSLES